MTTPSDPTAVPPAFTPLDTDAVHLLRTWSAPGSAQERDRRRVLDHLMRTPGATWRGSGPVHLTASLLVLDASGRQVLLALHRKARMWLQPGGHLEAGDTDVRAAALREGREESGIAGLEVLPGLVDVDCHRLGDGFARCREHLDLRFVARAPAGAVPRASAESVDLRWFPVDDLPAGTGPDVPRLVAAGRTALAPEGRPGPRAATP